MNSAFVAEPMGNMGVDAERAADLLGFTVEERAALLEHIAKTTDATNGNALAYTQSAAKRCKTEMH
jgi:hypothetical protein